MKELFWNSVNRKALKDKSYFQMFTISLGNTFSLPLTQERVYVQFPQTNAA